MRLLALCAVVVLWPFAALAESPPPPNATPSAQASELRRLIDDLPGVAFSFDGEETGPDLIVLTGVKLAYDAAADQEDTPEALTVARVELRGLNLPALRRVLDPALYTATQDRVTQLVAAQVVMTGMDWISGGTSMTSLDRLSIDALQMSQLGFTPGGPDFWAQFSTPEMAASEIQAYIRDALKIDLLTSNGFKGRFDSASIGTQPSPAMQPFAMTLDVCVVTQSNLDRAYAGRAVASDISLTFETAETSFSVTLQETTSDYADDSGLLKWMMSSEFPPVSRDVLYDYGPSCLKGLSFEVPDFGRFDVPMWCTERIKSVWLIPEAASMELKGVFTPALGDKLNVPGYVARYFSQPLDFTFGFSFSYDADKGEIAIDRYGFGLGGFGSIDYRTTGGGFDLETLMSLPQTYRDKLTLISGGITLTDDGGIEKILAMSAAAMLEYEGVTVEPEALRLQAKAGIDLAIGRFGNTPEVAAMGAAAKAFLDTGGALVATVTPPTPLKAADFEGMAAKGPAGMLSALGLKVEHTAP